MKVPKQNENSFKLKLKQSFFWKMIWKQTVAVCRVHEKFSIVMENEGDKNCVLWCQFGNFSVLPKDNQSWFEYI